MRSWREKAKKESQMIGNVENFWENLVQRKSDLDSKAFFSQIPQITFDFKRNNDNCLEHKMAVLRLLHSHGCLEKSDRKQSRNKPACGAEKY